MQHKASKYLVKADALDAVVGAEARAHVRAQAVDGDELRIAGHAVALPDEVPQLHRICVVQHLRLEKLPLCAHGCWEYFRLGKLSVS